MGQEKPNKQHRKNRRIPKYTPTSFCYDSAKSSDYRHADQKCPPGIVCCNNFKNGKADCGPEDWCS